MELLDEKVTPTDTDIAFYRTHGWFRSGRLFTDDEIDRALEGVAAHYAGERDRPLDLAIKKFLDWSPDAGNDLRVNDYIALQNTKIAALALKPLLGKVAARLAGTSQVRLFNSSLIYKPPGVSSDAVRIGWHTDRAYWQTCTSDRMLTAWIPLHDVDVDMGPVTMLDGSHRWPSTPWIDELRRSRSFICDDVPALEQRLRDAGERFEPVPMRLRKGHVSFHHCGTFHGSGLNLSDRPRISLVVHMQDLANRYRHRVAPDGMPYQHTVDQLVRRQPDGSPDYTDPDICPVIWDSAWEIDPTMGSDS